MHGAPPPDLFDTALIARRLAHRQVADFVHARALEEFEERLGLVTRQFTNALMMGPCPDLLPRTGRTAEADIAFTICTSLDAVAMDEALAADPRDLIVSILDLQHVNDVPGLLARVRRALKPDGLFLAVALGGETMQEIRSAWLAAEGEITGGATPRVAPMLDVRDAGALLQRAGFALPVAEVDRVTVRYADPLAALRDIKALGGANPLTDRSRTPVTRTLLGTAMARHAETASDPDGKVRVTLDYVWVSGWAPDPSQQKPLRPGSAKASLRDVLGDKSGN